MSTPKFSIITALKSSDPLIFKTADTLLDQLSSKVEWIIKNSDQNCSVELAELGCHDYVRLHCESDASIYDGLNQGLQMATGERFCVNGAGDTFEPGSIELILNAINEAETDGPIFFPIWYGNPPTGVIFPVPEELPIRMAVPNPGAILNISRARELGGFDPSYKIAADYDLICRYITLHSNSYVYQVPISKFLPGGMSERRRAEGFFEKQLVRVRVWGYQPDLQVAKR
jgi:glycosyltransferase